MVNSNSYNAADIEVLEGLEPVRKRPSMYIGGTDKTGLHHLVKEIVDNSVDEAMNGYADKIVITLHKDLESISVKDNGRGIPVDNHPKFKKPALELIFTTLHAGGKFSDKNYLSAGGLHGVGGAVVNALSLEMLVAVKRDGYTWTQEYKKGKVVSPLRKGTKTRGTGTTVFFRPDSEIFPSTKFDVEKIKEIAKEKAFLNQGLKIIFKNESDDEEFTFFYEEGIKSYLTELLGELKLQSVVGEDFYLEKQDGIKIETAFTWTEDTSEVIKSYVNGINTLDGGTHVEGFKSGLAKAIRNYINVHDLNSKGPKLSSEDMREGLVAILSINIPSRVSELQFQGQTKDKLNNVEVIAPIDTLLKSFENVLNANPQTAGKIIERIVLAARARAAARSASQSVNRKSALSYRLNLPGKLTDCTSNNPDKSELFIVEGDSAGGSAKQGRDRKTQAVFPLRGKILNSLSISLDKIKDNKELSDLALAIGAGIGDKFRVEKVRYGKVIILTDADADGMHIATLLMAFFFRFMRPLIEKGHLYLGLSPLYRVRVGGGAKCEDYWAFSDEERDRLIKKFSNKKYMITRFKGLGEMNPSTLWETTLDPAHRTILKITIDDVKEAAKMLEKLFGKDAKDRYEMICDNAYRLEADLM
ncbi:MAG: DNA gyrase/topoisomerase IV subunit B [Bdellovibrionota bacterium]